MPGDRLLSVLVSLKPVARIEKIKKEFNKSRHNRSKSKINEIRRNLYEIENKKNLFESKMKEIEKSLDELENNFSEIKKYYDYDDVEFGGTKDIRDLFDLSADRYYYKPVIINGAFNNNYIQYESKGNNGKIVTVGKYLDIVRPYLRDIINDHKIKSEWKTQLTIAFILFLLNQILVRFVSCIQKLSKLTTILKEYQKLNLSLISITGKRSMEKV